MRMILALAVAAAAFVASAFASAADRRAELGGQWKEYWGAPGELTYNDEYLVRIDTNGDSTVAVLKRDHPITSVEIKDNGLTFTEHTAFDVKYALSLRPDGQWLIGTATTPQEVVIVRWERVKN